MSIRGTGSYVPAQTVTTAALCEHLGSNREWVESIVGCRSRHIAPPEESTVDLAAHAACRAMHVAGVEPDEVDVLILATTTPSRAIPSTAALVQERLGTASGACFDMNATCGGFVYGLTCAASLLRSGYGRHAIVIGAETFSRITDYDHRDCVFFGDGAGAVVLSRTESDDEWLFADIGGGGTNRLAVTIPAGGSERPASVETVRDRQHYFTMNGSQVLDAASRHFPPFVRRFLDAHDLDLDGLDHLLLHQGSRHLLGRVAAELGISASRLHTNIAEHGNTASASVPLLLDQEVRRGTIRQGDRVLMAAFGAGWVWGAAVVPWAY